VAQVGALSGVRVLLVEDEQMTREAVTAVLEGAGATVWAVASAQAALAALPEARADVLLSDLAMRGEDGITLLQRIRALPPGSGGDLPAAAMTAQPSEEGRLRVLAAGFSHCLVKPLEPAQLIALLGRLARRTATPAGG
jgi:CheY-like chemotaxis protein